MTPTPLWFWIAFNTVVLLLLVADLFLLHRHEHPISYGEAIITSIGWVALSAFFGGGLWLVKGHDAGLQFFTGYLIEYSLSLDNIFIFVLIFTYFQTPPRFQHRVLFWGILGALVLRGVMIGLGALLVARFHWVLYLFGAFLLFTGARMLLHRGEKIDLAANPILRWCRRRLPLTDGYHGKNFIVRDRGKLLFTPLALVLIIVECTDLLFAVDSIPAIFAVTQDPFIVYTSNVCAILGLRSLYFLMAGAMTHLYYLKTGLALVLTFIGAKMLMAHFLVIPTAWSLVVVAGVLLLAVVASLARPLWVKGTEGINQ